MRFCVYAVFKGQYTHCWRYGPVWVITEWDIARPHNTGSAGSRRQQMGSGCNRSILAWCQITICYFSGENSSIPASFFFVEVRHSAQSATSVGISVLQRVRKNTDEHPNSREAHCINYNQLIKSCFRNLWLLTLPGREDLQVVIPDMTLSRP